MMFLTLGLMPSGAVVVWRGSGKNTHDKSREAELTILMIYMLR